jgi:uncharacterized phosphosugar-binding protein
MLAGKFADAARNVIAKIESTQMDAIQRAGDAIARTLADGGAFWLYKIGHGGELELRNRAGGLVATQVFSFQINVRSPIAEALSARPRPEGDDSDLEMVRLAVKRSEMREGDVLMLASVSGRNRTPVDVSLAARDIGATVIGITSSEYTAEVESLHPSGQKLCDVADIIIDNCAPFGDACVDVPGREHKALPISGVANITSAWMVCAEVIERLEAMGKHPQIFMSQNRPGGLEHNEKARAEYNRVGY